MEQVVQPNLSVIGYPDYCLAYVEQVFGVKSDPDPDAWQGWLNTKFKHTNPTPNNVSVPVWFSWTGTINGVTQNWGHVAVSTPNGVFTNPLSGSGHKVFASVPALATAYGVQYVGWSEGIGNLRVVGDSMVPTADLLNSLFKAYLGRPANAQEQSQFINKISYNDLIPILEDNNAEHNALLNIIALGKAAQNNTVLKTGVYTVK